MTIAHKFTLGQRVRDKVTGFVGIAITRVEYMNGCVQYLVKPHVVEKDDEATKMPDGHYIDDAQLELVDQGILNEPLVMGVDLASGPDKVGELSQASIGGPSHREGELPR